MAGTTLQLGYSDPRTDTFGAHPLLGAVLDLNDGVTFTLVSPDGLEAPAPPRTLVLAGNIRSQGEIATRAITRHNRMVTARVLVGPATSSAALIASVRTLLLWLSAPPQTPITLKYQPYNASTPLYLDVVGASHNLPTDEGQWLRGQFEPLTLSFVCRPGMRGARVTLSNLVPNAGMEQPGGPAVTAFADPFADANAYTLSNPSSAGHSATVASDSPLRYYRLDETTGTTATDSGSNAQNGTYSGATLGVIGILGPGNDGAVSFSGAATSDMTAGGTGLPSGNHAFSLEVWVKISGFPASNAQLISIGSSGTNTAAMITLSTSGKPFANFQGGASVNAVNPLSLNTWHHLVMTWDGTTMTLYVDGVSVGTPITPGAGNLGSGGGAGLSLAANLTANGSWFAGALDEAAVYNSALASGRVSAHYVAGGSGSGASISVGANQLTIPTGTRVAFGSPGWSSLALWQLRFKYASGVTARYYAHYTDASDYLRVSVSGTSVALEHCVAGITTTVGSATISLTSGNWYWLQLTQFPGSPGNPPYLTALLIADSAGSPTGSTLATLTGPAASDTVALSGRPQIEASGPGGSALVIGGAFANVHTVSLFGPGGWALVGAAGSAVVSGAWEGNGSNNDPGGNGQPSANTYSGGPVRSFGALRLDAPPAGAWDATWRVYSGGTPDYTNPGGWAIPCSPAQTLQGSIWVRSSGLSAAAVLQLTVREYDASGALLRSGTLASATGNKSAWTQLSGSYTTGTGCVYVGIGLRGADSTTLPGGAGASANATVWADNALLWNQTATGMSTMPWCDLRAVVSPATLVVSGLQGDLPAPAHLSLGSYLGGAPGLAVGQALHLYAGRKGVTSPNALLVSASQGAYSAAFSPQSLAARNGTSWGGHHTEADVGTGGWNPRAFSLTAADASGSYHLLARVKTDQSNGGDRPLIQLRAALLQQTTAWFNAAAALAVMGVVGEWEGAWALPFVGAGPGDWLIADVGPVTLPPFAAGALADPAHLFLTPRCQWQDPSGTTPRDYTNWQALLPVDGSLLVATLNNPGNSVGAVTNSWVWTYSDGLLLNRAGANDGPSWTYSLETTPAPNPGAGAGGAGTASSGSVNVNSGADPLLLLDPTLAGSSAAAAGQAGVNQVVAIIADTSDEASVLACFAEVSYAPLYLEPR